MSDGVTGPAAGARMTEDYLRSVGKVAYLWAWPLVNLHNRLSIMEKLPGPGLLGGIVPAASPGSAGMLHDYIRPEETTYFYQDLDEHGDRLDGSRSYALTFPPGALPPVRGFWSLTLYNEHHFFHPNELDRYSLGTKNKDLRPGADGSLTLTASAIPPDGDDLRRNWLPAPAGPFSLYLRAYWPDQPILDGTWTPPPVTRLGLAG